MNAKLQGPGHFPGLFAHAREYDLCRVAACGHHALQLAFRDDVKAGAQARQDVQYSNVGVGFHGIADEVIAVCERALVFAESCFQRFTGVDITGGAVGRGNIAYGYIFGIQLAVTVGEVFHGLVSSGGRSRRSGRCWRGGFDGLVQRAHLPTA